jgi:hypothetical protein
MMPWRHCWFIALLALPPDLRAGTIHAGGDTSDGEAVTCDLPPSEHLRNTAGRDGLGLCVFTSIDHAARWANEPALIGFRDFMTKEPGGGWPEKVDEYVPRMAASKGLPAPPYVQHTGGDPEFLKLALKTGRYVCVTYNGRDGVFYRGPIAHMVNLVHLSDSWAVIHDNNYPGQWLWLPPAEFLSRWRGSGGGWAVVLLKPGPPPVPVNGARHGAHVIGQSCPGGICPLPPRVIDVPSTELRWKPDAESPGWFYLYRGSTQVGTWHPDGRGYKELLPDGSFAAASEPPLSPPGGAVSNFGLDPRRVPAEARYRLNGKEVSRREALAAFGALADDSGKLRLTIVGDADLRKRVLDDLANHPALKGARDRLLVQDYPPGHWAVAGVGFAPGVTLQPPAGPDGTAPVLFRMTSYAGPDALATALRKADPNYRPERDPDPAKPAPAAPPVSLDPSKWPTALWVLGGIVLVLVFFRRKEKA